MALLTFYRLAGFLRGSRARDLIDRWFLDLAWMLKTHDLDNG